MRENRAESVVVVGGGIIGIACAHYLTEAGYQVSVIDQSEIGGGCSHANCGFICPSHVLPLAEPGALMEGFKSLLNSQAAFRVKPQLRLSLYQWILQFARRCTHSHMVRAGGHLKCLLESSMEEYRSLFAREDLNCEWKENGLLYVLQTEAGLDKFAQTDSLLTEHYGLAARPIESEELIQFDAAYRPGLAGAFFYEDSGSVRPDKLVSAWRSKLFNDGVEYVEHCALDAVCKTTTGVASLQTSRGEMVADHYVFACGAWSSLLASQLDCKVPVEPGKGYSVTMSKPDICPQYPALFPEHHIGITPFDESYRIGSMMEFVGFDKNIPPARIELLRTSAHPYLKTSLGDQLEETWYGWRPMTWDSLPIVGRIPAMNNSYLATGHNMLGLSLAPVTGRLIAEMIQEKTTHVSVEALSPTRF